MVTYFDTTFGIGGWLDLTQQGLSPCKKYRASWRSSVKSYRIIELVQNLYLHTYPTSIWENEVNHEHHKGDCFT